MSAEAKPAGERRFFGTDGVRGPYGGPVVNEAFAERLGAAAGRWAGGRGIALVGRDTRSSGAALAAALERGLAAAGMDVVDLGLLPTPAICLSVARMGGPLGAAITASHNPATDNGFKFFRRSGVKLSDEEEARIEQLLAEPSQGVAPRPVRGAMGGLADYMRLVGGLLPEGALQGWKVVLDTANGATCLTSPAVFRALGAQVLGIGDTPDGCNINAGVGSECPAGLAERVLAEGARLGVAHDGDGDRCILVDEEGRMLDGDEMLAILATDLLARGLLPGKTLVATVQSNAGLDRAIERAGGRVLRTPVGDRYVSERMREVHAGLGGESSGHIIFSEISPSGDGLVAAVKVADVMRRTGKPLSELRRVLVKFPQATSALRVLEKPPVETLGHLSDAIRSLEAELGSAGRVLVRYSGTEPKLRLLVEAPTKEGAAGGLAKLEAAARGDGIVEGSAK